MENKPAGRNRCQLIMVRLNKEEKDALDELVRQFKAQFPGVRWSQSDVMRNALDALHRETFHEDIATVVKRKKEGRVI